MMTMNILTAAPISQRCLMHTTSTHKDSTTAPELIVSKAANCGSDNKSSFPLQILREIPTKISQQHPTTTAVALSDDDDERRQHPTFSSPPDETEQILSPRSPLCDDDSFDYRSKIDAITTRCELMQQQWPVLLAAFDQTCAILTEQHFNHVPQPELSTPLCDNDHSFTNDKLKIPAPTAASDSTAKNCAITTDAQHYDNVQTLDPSPPQPTHATLDTVFQQSMRILDVAKQQSQALQQQSQALQQQSQALQTLTAKSEELLALMTLVVSAVDHLALVPSPHSMTTTTITLPTAPAPDITKLPVPTRHPSTLYERTNTSPGPPLLVLFQNPAQKLKPLIHKQRAPVKPFVVRGCPGKVWTKDNLRPP